MIETRVKDGFENIHEQLVAKKVALRQKYDEMFENEAKTINNMIAECTEEIEVADPVVEETTEVEG